MTTGVGRIGFSKITGKHMPTGYWGRYAGHGVDARVACDQAIFKMLKSNVDKVLGMGLRVDLWREVSTTPFAESAPIAGIAVGFISPNTPTGDATLSLTISGSDRNVTWTAPGAATSVVVDVAAGGTFRLESGRSRIILNVDAVSLPSSGGPYSNTVTLSRGLARTPNFDPQMDQTTLTNDGFPLCSCYKETSKQGENKCRSCYGTGVIPGYTKFGHGEFFVSAIDATVTLTNCSLNTDVVPFRVLLDTGQTSGTVESTDFTVSNAGTRPFEYRTDTYIRQSSGTSVTVEFSTNAGGAWDPIENLNTVGGDPPTSGTLRFRFTLARTLAADRSPAFEIFRVRHPRLDEPYVRVLKGLPMRKRGRENYGVVEDEGNLRYWTVPLRHFDDAIQQDPDVVTPPEDNIIQQEAFVAFIDGVHTGLRFDCTSFDYHDPDGIFISQGFGARRLQFDEIQYTVF